MWAKGLKVRELKGLKVREIKVKVRINADHVCVHYDVHLHRPMRTPQSMSDCLNTPLHTRRVYLRASMRIPQCMPVYIYAYTTVLRS